MESDICDVPAARDAFVDILTTALTRPAALAPAGVEPLRRGRPPARDEGDACRLWLSAVAGLLYARPDLVDDTIVDRLAELATSGEPADDVGQKVVRLFEFLASGRWAPRAWTLVTAALRDRRIEAATRERLVPLVADFVRWNPGLVGLDDVLSLAESPVLASHRAFLLDYGVEPYVFSAPEGFTEDLLERAAALFARTPRYRYFLHSLACRRQASSRARAWADRRLAGCFAHRGTAAAVLKARPVELLVVHNLGMGQGDDIVRLVPLLQALLDANPGLSVTVITQRTYLYDNPRVTPVAIADAGVETVLAAAVDGVVELFQPDRPEFAFRADLHPMVERMLLERRPPFVVTAELGHPHAEGLSIRSEFVYRTVELAGQDIAASCGLDRRGLRSIYEPCMRLQAELGLPGRVAEEAPLGPSVLTGVWSADAARVWRGLVGADPAVARRPIALVNPFGGSMPTKGFLDQTELLAGEIGGLVDEGHLVVVLPNGTAWGTRGTIDTVLDRLSPETRAFIRLAPDPAETDEAARLEMSERPELSYADRVVRLFKYFTTYADVVVTVEGWMAHLAYCLGRPFRLFLAASSFSFDWYPYGRGPTQRLVTTLSPRSRVAHSTSALVGDGDPPPLPHRPRKTLLELGLDGLGRSGRLDALPPLRRAAASPDNDARGWAIAALGRISPAEATKPDLLAALEERSPSVVRVAAEALLRGAVDCSRELGPRYRELLNVHVDIARRDWEAVARVGAAALPALFRAAVSDSYLVQRESRLLLRRMLGPYVGGLPPEVRIAGVKRPG